MKITKIERAKKNKFKINIFIDGEFSFSVYEDVFLKMKFRSGMEIDSDFIETAKKESEFEHGKHYLLNILSRKNYTEKELMAKLLTRNIDKKTATALIEKIRKMGFLDDEKYMKDYFEYLKGCEKYSKLEILYKMKTKFSDNENLKMFEEMLRDYDEKAVLLKLTGKIKQPADAKSVTAKMARKGFRYEDISNVLRTIKKEE
ncbi:MAG: RecX family transcriptional regulator [bacterium]|nr:RecX family transcriptional regulator [bacterium]